MIDAIELASGIATCMVEPGIGLCDRQVKSLVLAEFHEMCVISKGIYTIEHDRPHLACPQPSVATLIHFINIANATICLFT